MDYTHVIFRYIAGLYPNAPFETRNRVKGCSESIKTSSFDVTYAPIYDCCREFTGLKLIFICMRSAFQCDFLCEIKDMPSAAMGRINSKIMHLYFFIASLNIKREL